ncbi:MAG: YtxH domain-containing protein [Chlamydiales bacterium]
MTHKKSGRGKGFALGAFFGGLFGGMAVLFFAPKSGKKMRKDVAKKCHHATSKGKDMIVGALEGSSKLCKSAKTIVIEAKKAASRVVRKR